MDMLSNEMCTVLKMRQGATTNDFFELLKTTPTDILDGLIATEQARMEAQRSLGDRHIYDLHVVSQIGNSQERFCTVNIQGDSHPILVGMVSSEPPNDLPTALENLVLWTLIEQWHEHWNQTDAGPVSDWRTRAGGKAIVALPKGTHISGLRLVCAMFGLEHADIGVPALVPPLLAQAGALDIARLPDSINPLQARLLSEAATVHHPKWRFLSLYRILENSYLANIKNAFLNEFDADATRAVDAAKEKLSSELNQLVALADECSLKVDFECFNQAFEEKLTEQNKFFTSLDRAASRDQLYRSPERYKKAILRFYKLRCSIAHAGTSGVIYEQFPDADVAVSDLLASVETIALKSMKILSATE